ncbi:MAG: hypothetical protein IJ491_04095 [Clostridia bacterium]|nr:hypothetical protein [Clostridia bacterium]
MKKSVSLFLAFLMIFSLCVPAAASGTSDEENQPLRLVVPEGWEMNIGDSRTVEAVFSSEITNRVLTWESQYRDIASVDEWGRVTALGKGTTAITASNSDGISHSVVLTVTETSTKIEKDNKEKHDFNGEAAEENNVLQKLVTRYAKENSEAVPDFVKDEGTYADAKKAITKDNAIWTITDYGVLRTDENSQNERDIEQRFMGDRYFYSADTGDGNVLAIFSDGENGIWTAMAEGYTHIEMVSMNGTDKAAVMSDNTQEYVERRGMVANAYYNEELSEWIPNETDNDGLWTAMYGAGELMRYAVLRDDPTATAEEIEKARNTATLSTEAVLFLTYVSMRQGTTESYIRAQRNGNVTDLDLGKYYTNEALLEGGDYSQNIPGVSPADAFEKMNKYYMLFGKRSYIMSADNLELMNSGDWADPSVETNGTYAKRTRLLEGFWARTYSLKDENNPIDGNIYWVHNGDGTATGVSSKQPDEDEYLLHGENLRGVVTDASGEMPQRLWDDLIGSGYDLTDVVYKGDTSADEVIGHLFIYKLAYDILGPEDPEIKEMIETTMTKFAQHLVDNGYSLCEATGQPTTWGKYNRTYFHNGQNVGGGPLQSAVLLTAFKLTAYVTGDKKWEDEYRMAALDPAYEYATIMTQDWERYKMAILEYAANVSPVISFLVRPLMDTEIVKVIYRMILNYSDEEMAMLAYYLLFQMEDDEDLLAYYKDGLEDWWYSISFSENPLWYYIYQLAYPDEVKSDYYGNSLIETAAWSLSRHPIDTTKYSATNVNRDDVRELDLEEDCGIGGTRVLSYDPNVKKPLFADSDNGTLKLIGILFSASKLTWKVAAPDERALHKFNSSTYQLDDHHSPYSMEGSTTYTLPYWMGRYHGMLEA